MTSLSEYAGLRVLVTGHTGFKGAWLCRCLQHLGARVVGLSLPAPTRPSLIEEANLLEGLSSHIGDVRDQEFVRAVVTEAAPDVVFHLAAQPLVRAAFADPITTFSTNVMGTAHVLEALRRVAGLRAVVVATTDKVYENREWAWGYRETDRLGGSEPYAASKAATELVVAAYQRSYFGVSPRRVGLATVRAGNVIGGGDWAEERIVPDIVRAALSTRPVRIRSPRATRPWQHVLDPVLAYLRLGLHLAERPEDVSRGWNFGPRADAARNVWELARRVAEPLGVALVDDSAAASGPKETHHLALDSTLAGAELGWRPLFDFDESVALTMDWYLRWLQDRASARSTTDEQIAAALARAASAG